MNINLTLVLADGFQFPVLRQALSVNRNLRFRPTKFTKDFFVPKKQKHKKRLTWVWQKLGENAFTKICTFMNLLLLLNFFAENSQPSPSLQR
ncbi:hypothetical protein [Mucilaginibacter arboris]|uniref:hypothetical protein n=1 Tax=Mucilaginibacter arboris TaxID=2682090 RepID=UPI0018DD96CD|nr:hypothetical protein [Mucilaginibacter arboris]